MLGGGPADYVENVVIKDISYKGRVKMGVSVKVISMYLHNMLKTFLRTPQNRAVRPEGRVDLGVWST